MTKLLIRVPWIIKESKDPYTDFPQTKSLVNSLIKPRNACLYLDTMYYNNTMNIHGYVRTFKHQLENDTWSYYTLHLLMDVYDIQSLAENNKHYMNESVLDYMMPNVYKLFLKITIQHVHHRFNHGLRSTFLEFERDIDQIFNEINTYIPQFTTKSDTPTKREKQWIFGVAFMIMSGLLTAYRIYKSYTFRKNVQRTLSYILSNQRNYQQNIPSNKKYLLSLAEITSSNFKDVHTDITNLKTETNNRFDRYLHNLMHNTADTIFYNNYILHYVNILHHLYHDLVTHNKIERIKSTLHIKCRNFISGLHILARNCIPESILHADVFSNILHGVSQYLRKDNVYTLLYGTAVNPYYGMEVVKSFILNGALFITISLPLKHHRAPILALYGLFSYHLPTDISDEKSLSSSYTKLQVSHPYLLLGDDQYALLDNNFDRQVVQYDHMYVQQEPLLLFRRMDKNYYISIIEHAPAKVITSTCTFLYYHKFTVHASLVTTRSFLLPAEHQ